MAEPEIKSTASSQVIIGNLVPQVDAENIRKSAAWDEERRVHEVGDRQEGHLCREAEERHGAKTPIAEAGEQANRVSVRPMNLKPKLIDDSIMAAFQGT
jgi:hypothetical protein